METRAKSRVIPCSKCGVTPSLLQSQAKSTTVVRRNLDNLTDEDKKLAAQMLDAKVYVYPDTVSIDGVIPILDDAYSDYLTSRRSG
jgi:hypothetical protein